MTEQDNYLTYEETVARLLAIPRSRERALFCLMYLTGARVSELNKVRHKDISEEEIDGKVFVLVTLFTEKNKLQKERIVPIYIEQEKTLLDAVTTYTAYSKCEFLFGHNRTTIFKWCKKYLGFNPHRLRHLRLTHLVTEKNFTEHSLTHFAGWSDPRPSKAYVHLDYRDMARKMLTK